MDRTKIAVAPQSRPAMYEVMAEAVVAAGAELVPVAEATALIWADPAAANEFPGVVAGAPQLEWVQLPYAGIENFADQLDAQLTWTCGKGVYADPVAEHVIALTLAGFRHLHTAIPATSWPAQEGRNLLGANVVVIGAGGIAESLVRLLEPWGTRVSVVRRSMEPMAGVERTVAQSDSAAVRELLSQADVVVLAAALTAETKGMVDAAFLASMQGTCVADQRGSWRSRRPRRAARCTSSRADRWRRTRRHHARTAARRSPALGRAPMHHHPTRREHPGDGLAAHREPGPPERGALDRR